jgi:hypothetical protein
VPARNRRRAETEAAAGPSLIWDSTLTTADHTLSVGDTVVDYAGLKDINCAIGPKTSGKWYAEVEMTVSGSNREYVGICQDDITLDLEPKDGNGVAADKFWTYRSNGQAHENGSEHSGLATAITGSVIGIAVDIDAGKVWFAVNNTWVEGSPSAGTGASFATVTAANIVVMGSGMNAATQYTIFGADDANYTPPSGFTYWDGA